MEASGSIQLLAELALELSRRTYQLIEFKDETRYLFRRSLGSADLEIYVSLSALHCFSVLEIDQKGRVEGDPFTVGQRFEATVQNLELDGFAHGARCFRLFLFDNSCRFWRIGIFT